jgi:hypothetical protein
VHGDASCVLALRRRCTLCMGTLRAYWRFGVGALCAWGRLIAQLCFGHVYASGECVLLYMCFGCGMKYYHLLQCFIYNASMSCERVLKEKDVAFEGTH